MPAAADAHRDHRDDTGCERRGSEAQLEGEAGAVAARAGRWPDGGGTSPGGVVGVGVPEVGVGDGVGVEPPVVPPVVPPVEPPVGVGAGVDEGAGVGVTTGVVPEPMGDVLVPQVEETNASSSRVTEPLRASVRPSTVAPVPTETLVSARIVPAKPELVPSDAELGPARTRCRPGLR